MLKISTKLVEFEDELRSEKKGDCIITPLYCSKTKFTKNDFRLYKTV